MCLFWFLCIVTLYHFFRNTSEEEAWCYIPGSVYYLRIKPSPFSLQKGKNTCIFLYSGSVRVKLNRKLWTLIRTAGGGESERGRLALFPSPELKRLSSPYLEKAFLPFPSLPHIALPYPGLMPDSGEHVPMSDFGERMCPHNVCIVFVDDEWVCFESSHVGICSCPCMRQASEMLYVANVHTHVDKAGRFLYGFNFLNHWRDILGSCC